jgi:putative oxidoreductase
LTDREPYLVPRSKTASSEAENRCIPEFFVTLGAVTPNEEMAMSEAVVPEERVQGSKGLSLAAWLVQIALALVFGMAGFMKSTRPMAQLAAKLPWTSDLPSGLVRFIGMAELAAAVGLILPAAMQIKPQLTWLAAAGLLVIRLFAVAFHLRRDEMDMVAMPASLAILAAFVFWARCSRAQITAR